MELQPKDYDDIELDVYIDQYLDGLLSEIDMDAFETKILEDKSLFQKVQQRKQLREQVTTVIEEEGENIFTEYLTEKKVGKKKIKSETLLEKIAKLWINTKPIWKYSLAPSVAIAIFLIFVLFQRNTVFKVNSELENILGKNSLRTETYDIEITSPVMGEKIDEFVQFSWQTEADRQFKVIILNNKGDEVDEVSTNKNMYTFKGSLLPGLYYWKLLVNDDWLYTGKFIIDKK